MMSTKPIDELRAVMARLRNPEGGCPWDLEQNFKSIAPYTIEEAYEVADAIEQNDMAALEDELGDLLLQVVYHAQMAQEAGHFNFDDVAAHVTAKMIHRHPHVFGEEKAQSAADVEGRIWEERKAQEKRKQGQDSILADVPLALPSVMRAQKLQKRAARVGFEWPEAIQVLDKLEEEIQELREAIANQDKANIHEEIGDALFCVINYGRMIGVDCETALRDVNGKFERRFRGIERELKNRGKTFEQTTLDEMELIWVAEKQKEKKSA
ncbi:MAG: nucleoside triphosphate pyrophosphohydrolase [Alphaproteobacteria bacterium]|nr:nucleoside triphosphate pyrophosphohydrolase [Alphaproteobacteria bacterium]